MLDALTVGTARWIAAGVFFIAWGAWYWRTGRGLAQKTWWGVTVVLLVITFIWPTFPYAGLISLAIGAIWLRRAGGALGRYEPAEARFEGGGIKRGLSSVEASVLLGKPFHLTLTLLVVDMARKGFVRLVYGEAIELTVTEAMQTRQRSLDKDQRAVLRRQAAQELGAVLYPYEELFLELFEQIGPTALEDIDFGIVVQPFIEQVAYRVGGFDMPASRDYYQAIIERAPVEARTDGVLVSDRERILRRNHLWILQLEDFAAVFDQGGAPYQPDWMADAGKTFSGWASELLSAFEQAVDVEDLQLRLGRSIGAVEAELMAEIARATYYG